MSFKIVRLLLLFSAATAAMSPLGASSEELLANLIQEGNRKAALAADSRRSGCKCGPARRHPPHTLGRLQSRL